MTAGSQATAASPLAAVADGPRKRRGVGLAARVLALIIVFVLIAEVAIFIPSVASFRRGWLSNRMAAAYTAALVIEAAPDGISSDVLKQRLLDSVGVRLIAIKTKDTTRLLAGNDTPLEIDEFDDFRAYSVVASIGAAFRTLAADVDRVVDIRATPPAGADYIEIAMDEERLQVALRAYSLNVLLLSLAISLFVASLAAVALSIMVLAPVRRLTGNVVRFAADPQDRARIISPSSSTHEIGQAERALAEMQRALAGELREKKHLADLGLAVAKIGHDLRNMLASAQLFSDRLPESADPVVARIAPKLVGTLDRAIRFCQTTLSYGRSVDETPRLAHVDLCAVATEALEAAVAGARKPVDVRTDLPSPLMAEADPEQMFRVVNNLCRNAVEALDGIDGAQRAVFLAGGTDGDAVWLRVCDTGPGLPARAREKLFVAFQGSVRAGGTGLGLAIAADLVRGHGGTLRVLEEPDPMWPGARFEIRLPAYAKTV